MMISASDRSVLLRVPAVVRTAIRQHERFSGDAKRGVWFPHQKQERGQ
jgi:hypothetical protein